MHKHRYEIVSVADWLGEDGDPPGMFFVLDILDQCLVSTRGDRGPVRVFGDADFRMTEEVARKVAEGLDQSDEDADRFTLDPNLVAADYKPNGGPQS